MNARRSPQDIASGRMLAPGEIVAADEVDLESAHDRALVDEGALIKAAFDGPDEELAGEELEQRARELNISGRSKMSADELREKIAEAEAAGADAGGDQ